MQKWYLILLLTLTLSPVWAVEKVIYLADYLDKYQDASLAFYHALEACTKEKANKLLIPPSTYHCHSEKAFQQYTSITNNENGLKSIALPIIEQANLEIDGQGSKIILHGLMMGSVIHRSKNIQIKNLSFDWDIPFYVQGKVVAVSRDSAYYDLQFADYVKYRVSNDDVLFDTFGKEYLISGNFWFDPDTGYPVYKLAQIFPKHWNAHNEPHYRLQDLGNQTIRVYNQADSLPEPGWNFVAKWRHPEYRINRAAPSIHLFNSFQVSLTDVKIHSAAGMGVIGERSGDIRLERVQVVPTPNSDRIVSVTADATHFVNCKGKVVLKDCLFESQLDDGLNIHGNYAASDRLIDDFTLGGRVVHRQQVGFQFALPDDTIRFINRETLLPTGETIVVKDIRYLNDSYFEIKAEDSIQNVLPEMGLENISWIAELEMTGCSIGKNWARSVLVKTPGKSVITNNRFYSSMQGVRNWGEMLWFYESGNVTDVLISNNQFIDLGRAGVGLPVIVINPEIKNKSLAAKTGFYNRNIRIINNTIRTFDRPILSAYSVDGLVFENNKIITTNTFEPIFPNESVIKIMHCNNLKFSGNHYDGPTKANIIIDEFSKSNGTITRNKGFVVNP
ncbi:MAG: right-handed parallel beta-helix repeat-containing protein [Bacteroidota bacterium]